MASLNITSFFTNIPLDETINICLNESFDKKQCVSNLDRANFEKLPRLATKESSSIPDNTSVKKTNDQLPFLDIKIPRDKNQFITSV